MALPEPKTREEMFLSRAATRTGELPTPLTRKEMFLNGIAVGVKTELEPLTREEMFLDAIEPSGGGGVNIETIDVTFDDVRQNVTLQLSSDAYNADNLIITSAVVQSGKYVDGVLYMDSVPTIYPTDDGVDYVNMWCKFKTNAAFNGKFYNSSSDSYSDVTNAFLQFRAGSAYRNNSTQNGGAAGKSIKYRTDNLVYLSGAVRGAMCQRGYYYKHHFKVYYWND